MCARIRASTRIEVYEVWRGDAVRIFSKSFLTSDDHKMCVEECCNAILGRCAPTEREFSNQTYNWRGALEQFSHKPFPRLKQINVKLSEYDQINSTRNAFPSFLARKIILFWLTLMETTFRAGEQ